MKACLDNASGLSILFPSTRSGIPCKAGLFKRSWSSLFAIDILSLSAASTTYLRKTLHNIRIEIIYPHNMKFTICSNQGQGWEFKTPDLWPTGQGPKSNGQSYWSNNYDSSKHTTYTIADTPRQYRSHMLRKRGCPPRSHSLMVTFPLVTFLMLKPT